MIHLSPLAAFVLYILTLGAIALIMFGTMWAIRKLWLDAMERGITPCAGGRGPGLENRDGTNPADTQCKADNLFFSLHGSAMGQGIRPLAVEHIPEYDPAPSRVREIAICERVCGVRPQFDGKEVKTK